MKNYILFLFTSLLLTGCSEDKVESTDSKHTTPHSKTTLSEQTEIKASVINSVTINTPTIKCKTCEKNIHHAFKKIDAVTELEVDLKNKTVSINYDQSLITVSEIRNIISKAGYDADDVSRDTSAYNKLDECCKDDSESHG